MNKIFIPMISVVLLGGMNSCGLMEWAAVSTPGTSNQTKGTVIGVASGARTGAVIGSITGGWDRHGDNALIGAAVGAVAGGIIGNAIGHNIDEKNRQVYGQPAPGRCDDYDQDEGNYRNDDFQGNDDGFSRYRNRHGDNAVYFSQGKTSLSRGARRALDNLAKTLRNDPSASVEVFGHTDNSGNYNSRRRISVERASMVKAYLRSKGVRGSQIYAQGCADQYPVADNGTSEGRARNRRVEIVMTHSGNGYREGGYSFGRGY